jgi:membrane fusion protein (multidrug efflux system)
MANAYAPLAWIARTDTVKILFEAGSRQALALAVGQRAVWQTRGTGDSGEGAISKLDLSADPESHLLSGEAVFPNPEGKLIPGLLVSFRVMTGERSGVVKIPVGCLMETREGFSVYVVERGREDANVVRLKRVETGLRTSDEVEITSGIEAGERVVEFGQSRLGDGDRVKIVSGGEGM